MLIKLSLSGIRNRLRDYLVLFSGLVIASGIFYMFQAMASNKAFLNSNSSISMTFIIFQLGSVLLAIITLVYILYANSFLMSMRQKDYAMFMMLGAKQRTIGQMIFIETFAVGLLASLLGSLAGIGLTKIISQLLIQQLEIHVTHFAIFNQNALFVTLIFFLVLFFVAAFVNATSIMKRPILTLLKTDATPTRFHRNSFVLLIETLLGIALLFIGYYMMENIDKFALIALIVALVTITSGTYLVFNSVMIFLLNLLKHSKSFSLKKLNNFTLSQLSFRMQNYTRMLSMVTMILALALGALTVGLGFRNQIPKMTEQFSPYDLVLNNAQEVDQKQVTALKPVLDTSYHMKENQDTIYFERSQFDKNPLKVTYNSDMNTRHQGTYSGKELAADVRKTDELRNLLLPIQRSKNLEILSAEKFAQTNGTESTLQLLQVVDFMTQKKAIHKLAAANVKRNPSLKKETFLLQQKYDAYTIYNEMFSGFEFMGFFLGIAFLTMLASCLMFKILSGATSDVSRYEILNKIGTPAKLLEISLRKEIAVLFLAPGILGVIHVLYGLKMFVPLLDDPYHQIWVPFLIFFVLYLIYYLLTVWLYSEIVLKKASS
ncbi:MAG TPA: FtsX-like permease family protein [Tetragenococcus sp.]|nr:FtsX-like permease family protein [Tetragenococcus sp.]